MPKRKLPPKNDQDKDLSRRNLIIASIVGITTILLFFIELPQKISASINVFKATGQIVVDDATWSGGGYSMTENVPKATCVHTFRLANRGGVSTDLTAYKVRISLGQSELELESSFESRPSLDKLTPEIGPFAIYLFPAESKIDLAGLLDSEGTLELPYPVAKNSMDVQTAVNFRYDSRLSLESPGRNDPKYDYYDPTVIEDHRPMMLTYTFKTAMGKEIKGPPVVCWYIK
jgi:hypothetical protein